MFLFSFRHNSKDLYSESGPLHQRKSLTYPLVFAVNFILCYFAMKAVNWGLQPKPARRPFLDFFITPYLSVRSLRFVPATKAPHLATFFINGLLSLILVVLARECLYPLSYLDVLLFSPFFLFFTEAVGALGQLLFTWNPVPTYPIHHRPLLAKSLSEFWGRHWNLWIQDWLRDISCGVSGRRSERKLLIAFLASGAFHEVMCNLPYFVLYKRSYFGTMLGYFLIQGAGLWLDKKALKQRSPLLRRSFLWVWVIAPSPLFINVPLLTFFGLYHG